jgi:hypothetical protein
MRTIIPAWENVYGTYVITIGRDAEDYIRVHCDVPDDGSDFDDLSRALWKFVKVWSRDHEASVDSVSVSYPRRRAA